MKDRLLFIRKTGQVYCKGEIIGGPISWDVFQYYPAIEKKYGAINSYAFHKTFNTKEAAISYCKEMGTYGGEKRIIGQ